MANVTVEGAAIITRASDDDSVLGNGGHARASGGLNQRAVDVELLQKALVVDGERAVHPTACISTSRTTHRNPLVR